MSLRTRADRAGKVTNINPEVPGGRYVRLTTRPAERVSKRMTPRYRTVDELVKALEKGPGRGGYLRMLERVDIPLAEFEPYCRWNRKHYTRTCIARNADFELLLICYEPGQRTSIHDFATEEAWIHPVKGVITEERFEPTPDGGLRKVGTAQLTSDAFSYMHNGRSIHRYINQGPERAITLNLYAKPLHTWRVYDEGSGSTQIAPAGS